LNVDSNGHKKTQKKRFKTTKIHSAKKTCFFTSLIITVHSTETVLPEQYHISDVTTSRKLLCSSQPNCRPLRCLVAGYVSKICLIVSGYTDDMLQQTGHKTDHILSRRSLSVSLLFSAGSVFSSVKAKSS